MRALSSIVVVCLVAAASVRPVDADELVRASHRIRVETTAKGSSLRAVAAQRTQPASGSVRLRASAQRVETDRGSGPSLSPALVVVAFAIKPPDVGVVTVHSLDSRTIAGRALGSSSARGPPSV